MTRQHSTGASATLDAALQSLPESVEPASDLWPAIHAGIAVRAGQPGPVRDRSWLWQAAAAVVLVAGSSLLTAVLLQRAPRDTAAASSAGEPGALVMPAAFGPSHALSPEYESARRQLSAMLQQRMARMPPSARKKLEANLAELRRAATEINAALDQQPGDPLLEELLLNTYQDELAVLAAVNQLTSPNAADAPADATRMQL